MTRDERGTRATQVSLRLAQKAARVRQDQVLQVRKVEKVIKVHRSEDQSVLKVPVAAQGRGARQDYLVLPG